MQRTLHLLVLFILLVLCEAAELKCVQLLCDLLCPATVDELPELQGGSVRRMEQLKQELGSRSYRRSTEVLFNSTLPEESQVKKSRNWISYSKRKNKIK